MSYTCHNCVKKNLRFDSLMHLSPSSHNYLHTYRTCSNPRRFYVQYKVQFHLITLTDTASHLNMQATRARVVSDTSAKLSTARIHTTTYVRTISTQQDTYECT